MNSRDNHLINEGWFGMKGIIGDRPHNEAEGPQADWNAAQAGGKPGDQMAALPSDIPLDDPEAELANQLVQVMQANPNFANELIKIPGVREALATASPR